MILLQLIQYENSTNFIQKNPQRQIRKKSTNSNHKKIHQFKPQEIHQLLSAIYLPEHMSVFPYWKHFWFHANLSLNDFIEFCSTSQSLSMIKAILNYGADLVSKLLYLVLEYVLAFLNKNHVEMR